MKIRFEVTIDDMLAFNRYHFINSSSYRPSLILGICLVCILPMALTIMFSFSDKLPRAGVLIVGGLLTLYVGWRYSRLFPKAIDRMTRRMLKGSDNKSLFGTHELEIEDEWLVERTDINASRQAWRAIEKIIETDDYVFIYLSAVGAHVIPKRSVGSGDLAAFLARARQLRDEAVAS